jgi:hypothetical protein
MPVKTIIRLVVLLAVLAALAAAVGGIGTSPSRHKTAGISTTPTGPIRQPVYQGVGTTPTGPVVPMA